MAKNIAFLTALEGIERVELTDPWDSVTGAGHSATLLSTKSGTVQTFDHLDKAETRPVDGLVKDASVDDYDALVLPGGVANPDALRADKDAVQFVRSFFEAGKPVASICHGAWTLVEADVVRGRTLTSWPSIRTDVENAWPRVVATVLGFLLILLVLSAFNVALFSNAKEGSWQERIPTIFVELARLVLVVVGLALLFQWVWNADVGGLIAALGVTSIVIGLALQNAVGGAKDAVRDALRKP